MTTFLLTLSLVVAAAVVAPLWLGSRPEEGWRTWFATSADAFRDRDRTTAVDTSLEELLSDPDNRGVPGYTTLDELRGMLDDTRAAVRR